ncbi:amino acid ABC transporter permease [Achromobacter sp. ESBL13]|uniref:amino acid ABC transporter permease n=1 Tax=Achromobacter sp. ESBL13 TaxID=3077328 RepID=UPI003FA557E2
MANDLAFKGADAQAPGRGGDQDGRPAAAGFLPTFLSSLLPALLRDPWFVLLLGLVALGMTWGVTGTTPEAVAALWHWSPALLRGLGVNVQISVLAMALGTLVGLVVGALSLSPSWLLRRCTRAYVLLFRNAPILVLVYFTTYVFPFELNLGGWYVPFPDWIKVVIGLGLPASANVAEIFRGAIQSIPSAQWEAAQSLAFRRTQIFRMVVLPQCVRRMLPSWMNLMASITMSTSLASLVGVHDLVDTATVASNTVARSDFTILVYFTLLALFFAYCYPIARWTRYLERRHEHH